MDVEMQEWQRRLAERVLRGDRLRLAPPRRDAALLSLWRSIHPDVVIVEASAAQAEAIFRAATDLVRKEAIPRKPGRPARADGWAVRLP